jgi:hypothetical protein
MKRLRVIHANSISVEDFTALDPYDQMRFLGELTERDLVKFCQNFRYVRTNRYEDAWCCIAVALEHRLSHRMECDEQNEINKKVVMDMKACPDALKLLEEKDKCQPTPTSSS